MENKKLKKTTAKLKPIRIVFKKNPEWARQFKKVQEEVQKLSKIEAFIIE